MNYKVNLVEDIEVLPIGKKVSGIMKSLFIRVQKYIQRFILPQNLQTVSIRKEVSLVMKSPWFYWYTGKKKVALISWGVSLFFPILIFLIAFFTVDIPLLYLLQFIMVIFLENFIWLVVGLLGILIITLNSIIPTWMPNIAADTIQNLIITLIIPLIVMAIYGFFQSRIITRVVTRFVS